MNGDVRRHSSSLVSASRRRRRPAWSARTITYIDANGMRTDRRRLRGHLLAGGADPAGRRRHRGAVQRHRGQRPDHPDHRLTQPARPSPRSSPSNPPPSPKESPCFAPCSPASRASAPTSRCSTSPSNNIANVNTVGYKSSLRGLRGHPEPDSCPVPAPPTGPTGGTNADAGRPRRQAGRHRDRTSPRAPARPPA